MTAEYFGPGEHYAHTHIEISPDDREAASKMGKLLGKKVVGATVKSLEQEIAIDIARNPNDPDITSKQYKLEVWYQTNILAQDEAHTSDEYTPEH